MKWVKILSDLFDIKMVEKRSSVVLETSNIQALCQHLSDQEQWTELKQFMHTHQNARYLCQSYYDLRLQYAQDIYPLKKNPNKLLTQACLLHDKVLYDLALELGAGDLNYGLVGACQGGYLDLINYLIKHGADDWDQGLYGACLGQQLEIARFMLDRGAHLVHGLLFACECGYQPMIDLMISLGADNWNYGFLGACVGGHWAVIQQMIQLILQHQTIHESDWDLGLSKACGNGSLDLIKKFIQEGEKFHHRFKLGMTLYVACLGRNRPVIDWLIDHGANDWNQGLLGACKGGHLDLVKEMIQRGQRQHVSFDWDEALSNAYYSNDLQVIELLLPYGITNLDEFAYICDEGQLQTAQFLLQHGAHLNQNNLNLACGKGQMHIVNLLIEHAHQQHPQIHLDWNSAMIEACCGGSWISVQFAIKQGANDWNGGFKSACHWGHLFLVQKMIELGATDLDRGLNVACHNGKKEIVNFLIQHGADPKKCT